VTGRFTNSPRFLGPLSALLIVVTVGGSQELWRNRHRTAATAEDQRDLPALGSRFARSNGLEGQGAASFGRTAALDHSALAPDFDDWRIGGAQAAPVPGAQKAERVSQRLNVLWGNHGLPGRVSSGSSGGSFAGGGGGGGAFGGAGASPSVRSASTAKTHSAPTPAAKSGGSGHASSGGGFVAPALPGGTAAAPDPVTLGLISTQIAPPAVLANTVAGAGVTALAGGAGLGGRSLSVTPEPGTLLLTATGLFAAFGAARRRWRTRRS